MAPVTEKDRPLIFALDTSTDHASVALVRGDEEIVVQSLSDREQTSSKLIQTVRSVFEQAGRSLGDVDLYAAVAGPGSFTGLRVGLASMKGLARVHRRPVASVSSLEATALLAGDSAFTCVLLNGRRNEVFTQAFAVEKDVVTPIDAPHAVPVCERLAQLRQNHGVLFAGDGVALYRTELEREATSCGITIDGDRDAGRPRFRIYSGSLELAVVAARLALRRKELGQLIESEALEAFYVRSSDAELKLKRAFPSMDHA